jgi:beta-mannosidase
MRFTNYHNVSFHSMPSFYSWEEVLMSPDDFSFNSTVVMSRDHHPSAGNLDFPNPNAPKGQAQMADAVSLWLPNPSTPDSNQTFTQMCWSTQIFQTMAMVSQVAFYRRGAGQGENNLGALVWQLNDIWQGVSWSSIEYSGRWKVTQYGLTSIFSPLVIYPFWTAQNETLQVLVVSDRWEEVSGSAQLTWYDWRGTPLNTSTHEFTVPTLNNSLVFKTMGLSRILPTGKNATDVWLHLTLTAEVDSHTVTNEQVVSFNLHHLLGF